MVVSDEIRDRLADSFRTALDLTSGIATVEFLNAKSNLPEENHVFSENFACPVSGFTIPEIEPRLFSFNAPFGACSACDGLGLEGFFDINLIVPDSSRSLLNGAIAPWLRGNLLLSSNLGMFGSALQI